MNHRNLSERSYIYVVFICDYFLIKIREDGNPDMLENGYINFTKRSMMANAIQEIMQWQYTPYHLEKVAPISEALEKVFSDYFLSLIQ